MVSPLTLWNGTDDGYKDFTAETRRRGEKQRLSKTYDPCLSALLTVHLFLIFSAPPRLCGEIFAGQQPAPNQLL
jgi:hypothetical protein